MYLYEASITNNYMFKIYKHSNIVNKMHGLSTVKFVI